MKYVFSKLSLSFVLMLVASTALCEGGLEKDTQEYLFKCRDKEFLNAAKHLYCPDTLTSEEYINEIESISDALSIFYEEFGPLVSAKISSDTRYQAVSAGCGDVDFWRQYPPTKQIIYETIHKKDKHGYIVFSFSKVGDNYVLAFVNHGVPLPHGGYSEKVQHVLDVIREKRGRHP